MLGRIIVFLLLCHREGKIDERRGRDLLFVRVLYLACVCFSDHQLILSAPVECASIIYVMLLAGFTYGLITVCEQNFYDLNAVKVFYYMIP